MTDPSTDGPVPLSHAAQARVERMVMRSRQTMKEAVGADSEMVSIDRDDLRVLLRLARIASIKLGLVDPVAAAALDRVGRFGEEAPDDGLPSNPLDLLTEGEQDRLKADLAAMARLRRRVEVESRGICLA